MSVRALIKAFKCSNSYLAFNSTSRFTLCGCNKERFYSSKAPVVKYVDPVTGEEKKKKTTRIPKITLISDDNVNILTMEEAQKLAKRRDLKLVKIMDLDTKTQRPLYKLMTGSEYHTEDLKQRELRKSLKQNNFSKGEKVLMLNAKISEHDLQTQTKKISKWIAKMYEVRTVISGDTDKTEKVYNYLESTLKDEARFMQKRQKGTDIKFQIMPPKKSKNDSDGGVL